VSNTATGSTREKVKMMREKLTSELNSHQVWPEMIDNGTKGETIAPRCCPVGQFNALVATSHLNAPVQQFCW